MFPFLIPSVVAAFLLWNTSTCHSIRARHSSRCTEDAGHGSLAISRTVPRFGISEMLGATAAFALLMGVGRFRFEFILQGMAIEVWFIVQFLLSCRAIPAYVTMMVCLFFVGFEDPRSEEVFVNLLVVASALTFFSLRLMNHLGTTLCAGNVMNRPKPGHGCATVFFWTLAGGIVTSVVFMIGLFAYSELVTDGKFLATPTAHGAWGPTTGMLVMTLGAPAAMLIGFVTTALIAAKRNPHW